MHSIGLADFKAMWTQNREGYLAAADRVGKSGWLILGKEVEQFEEELARLWGTTYAVGVANGLDALEIAFRCVGMKEGDKVITTPLSAFATTLAILRVRAVPVFVDVDASGLLDLEQVETAAAKSGARYLVPVHLYGHALNLGELQALAERLGLTVIEDCAQAIGARSHGRAVGTVGAACATSFYPTKNLGALGDGGALLTSDAAIRDRARTLRDYGQTDKYVHDEVGLNSRLDELQAALLRSVQLPQLAAQSTRRRELAARYRQGLDPRIVEIPPVPPGSDSVWHLFPVLVADRSGLRDHLLQAGVAAGLHYPRLIPEQKAMHGCAHEVVGELGNARRFSQQELSLPLHPFLSDDDTSRVIDTINSYRGLP